MKKKQTKLGLLIIKFNIKSKTEAMYFPPYEMRKAEIPENLWTGSYDIGDGQFISFCQAFQYLGTFLTPTLDDNFDIDSRITAATKVFYSMHNVLLPLSRNSFEKVCNLMYL